mgnify:CR=1 FL=1
MNRNYSPPKVMEKWFSFAKNKNSDEQSTNQQDVDDAEVSALE